jgi:integrase
LLRICEGKKEGWVFPSRQKGKHITSGLVNKQFVKARRSAGLPESMVLYSGRHDCGTTLMEETGNLKGVMQWLGHVDVKAALRYQRPRMELMRAAMNRRGKKAAVLEFRAQSVAQRKPMTRKLLIIWLPPRDSNPDMLIQSQLSYH